MQLFRLNCVDLVGLLRSNKVRFETTKILLRHTGHEFVRDSNRACQSETCSDKIELCQSASDKYSASLQSFF